MSAMLDGGGDQLLVDLALGHVEHQALAGAGGGGPALTRCLSRPSTASSSSSAATTRCTKPMRSALAASKRSPVRK
jgi:hypothetical protein